MPSLSYLGAGELANAMSGHHRRFLADVDLRVVSALDHNDGSKVDEL